MIKGNRAGLFEALTGISPMGIIIPTVKTLNTMPHSATRCSLIVEKLQNEYDILSRAYRDLNKQFRYREIEIRELKAELKACHDGLAQLPRIVDKQAD